ncbi:MAG TPA: glycosyltransferase family 4 protein [Myxococcaceae bacterium]|nr:glycosyltransferase family 4 protein [Myxococcaceae bacterium]
MALVIHPHFHRRYTGATRHVETVVPPLARRIETRVIGRALDPNLPFIRWRELLRRARREPVVWHAHRVNELAMGLLLKLWGRRVRLAFTRHASTRPHWFTSLIASRADRAVALTPEIAAQLPFPSTIVQHGVDLSRFRPPADRNQAYAALGLGGRYGVGVIGRVRREKGQGDFVAALAPLLPRYPEWRAVLVGLAKNADRSWAESLRQQLGGALILAGERMPIEPWYQGLTVLVHPSYTEGYSLVHVEALASGCCVVSSRLPYVETLIEHGRTGFLYEIGDAAQLREILEQLLREPGRALEVGRNAAEHARRHCGVEQEAAALYELYRAWL